MTTEGVVEFVSLGGKEAMIRFFETHTLNRKFPRPSC